MAKNNGEDNNLEPHVLEQQLDDIREILNINSGAGMRFFQRLFDKGFIFSTTFTGNSQGMFLEGHRNFALEFFADVAEAAPEKVQLLIVKSREEKA